MGAPDPRRAIVVGAGPAGLAAAACLGRAGIPALILDRGQAVGDSWAAHYDRLHLHTARTRSALPFMAMPARFGRYPARDDVVAYLRAYAEAMRLDIRLGTEVTAVRPGTGGWRVETGDGTLAAPLVVIATGLNGTPNRPDWPGLDGFGGPVLHSSTYRNAAPFAGQRVLVVGFGNSGGEIALDLAETGCTVSLSVRGPVNILPREVLGVPVTSLGLLRKILPYRWADAITAPLIRAIIGRPEDYGLAPAGKGPVAQVIEDERIPLIDVGALAAIRAGRIAVRPGIAGFAPGEVRYADGRTEAVDAVILATGYRLDLRRLLPENPEVLDARGAPRGRGATRAAPGLHFASLAASAEGQLRQAGLDARAIAADAARQARARAPD